MFVFHLFRIVYVYEYTNMFTYQFHSINVIRDFVIRFLPVFRWSCLGYVISFVLCSLFLYIYMHMCMCCSACIFPLSFCMPCLSLLFLFVVVLFPDFMGSFCSYLALCLFFCCCSLFVFFVCSFFRSLSLSLFLLLSISLSLLLSVSLPL